MIDEIILLESLIQNSLNMSHLQRDPQPDPADLNKRASLQSTNIDLQAKISEKTTLRDQYTEEKYRWVIIFLASLAFTINNLANNAIIPISSKVAEVYNLDSTYANLPIQITFLINPIMNFTAGHFMDSKGLGISFRIGAVLYAVGLLGFALINYGYHFVLIGAIIIAIGQPLIMNCPAKVATFWFVNRNRTLAVGIINAINIVTLGISLVFPALFVAEQSKGQEAKDQIYNLYSKYFLASVAVAVLILILMKDRPQQLPSAGAQEQKTSLCQTLKIIKADTNLWKFFIAAILLYGTFLSFGSTSNMLFKPYGFEDTQIALFGVSLLVSGIIGSVAYTYYIKRTLNYKFAIICACTLTIVFTGTTALLMNFVPQQRLLISLMILGMGFNLITMVPISHDLGCELTFPVGQAQVVGIMTASSMLYTVILTLSISSIVGFGQRKQSAINMGIYISLFLIGSVLYCLVNIDLKRRKMQEEKQNKNRQDSDRQDTLNNNSNVMSQDKIVKKKSQTQQELVISDELEQNGPQFVEQGDDQERSQSPVKIVEENAFRKVKKVKDYGDSHIIKVSGQRQNEEI